MLRNNADAHISSLGYLFSQSLFSRKIVEIEHFALRVAILKECQNYLGGGGWFGRKG